MLVALVVALRLVDALVGLLLVPPAGVVVDLAPGVLVPRRVPAQPAEGLRSQRCNVHVPAPWHNALLAPHREQEPFPCLYTAALIKKGPMAIMASTMDLTSQSTSDVLVLGLRPPATVMSLNSYNNSIAI